MATQWTLAEFEAWYKNLFTEHDKDADGKLYKDEAGAFARAVHAAKDDGSEFNADRAAESWGKMNVDGYITNEAMWERMLDGAKKLGKIAE